MLSRLPCGGLGELGPENEGMRMDCVQHDAFTLDAHGNPVGQAGEPLYQLRKLPSCGAITNLDAAGVRRVVGYRQVGDGKAAA